MEKEKKKKKKGRRRRGGGGKNAQFYISLTRGFSPRGVAETLETLDPEAPREVSTSRGPNFPDFEIFEVIHLRVYNRDPAIPVDLSLGDANRGFAWDLIKKRGELEEDSLNGKK